MKNTIYGYCRISTMKQSIQRQIDNIKKAYPEATIISEEYTGTKMDRPKWNSLYKNLKSGDTVVFDEVSRMSRNAEEGIAIYEELFDRGVNLIFIKEPYINTSTYKEALNKNVSMTGEDVDCILEGVNKYLKILAKKQIRLAFEQAQIEVDYLHQRTKEGIDAARANGKQIGRAAGAKITTHKAEPIKALIRKYSKDFEGHNTDEEVMGILAKKTVTVTSRDNKTGRTTTKEVSSKLARNTYYKYKAELKAE